MAADFSFGFGMEMVDISSASNSTLLLVSVTPLEDAAAAGAVSATGIDGLTPALDAEAGEEVLGFDDNRISNAFKASALHNTRNIFTFSVLRIIYR